MRSALLLGDGDFPRAVDLALRRAGAGVLWVRRPADDELAGHLRGDLSTVLVVSRNDIEVLRLALLVEHARPDVRLIVTIFDRTIADQLRSAAPGCRVVSMADLVAPALAGPCLSERLVSIVRAGDEVHGVAATAGGPSLVPLPAPRPVSRLRGCIPNPYGTSARFLLAGFVGFVAILLLDVLLGAFVLHEPLPSAFYSAVKALLTVGPNPAVDHAATWVRVVEPLLMPATFAFAAILTAGIVNRLGDRRLTAIVGPRAVPRRDHVVVVGLGQVGVRLCLLLRRLGVPVVAVERDPDSLYIDMARANRIPVVIARGGDRRLLQRLRLTDARALAAVTSDDLENVSISVAGLAVAPEVRVILRAGDGDVTAETRSLFHIGEVRDVHKIAGELIAAAALGLAFDDAAVLDGVTWVISDTATGGRFTELGAGRRG